MSRLDDKKSISLICWLLVWLLACWPAMGLEIHPVGPPPYLIAESATRGFSSDDQLLKWWDLEKQQQLKSLEDPICLISFEGNERRALPRAARISYQQSGDRLFTWCQGEEVLSQWHIPSGTLLKRTELKGLAPFSTERSPGNYLPPAWISDNGYALMRHQRELIRLFDAEGHVLKELEPENTVEQLWMNGQYLASRTRQTIQLWRVPELQPARTFTISIQEQVLGLTKNRLVSRLYQPLCNTSQQSVPLDIGLSCRKEEDPQTGLLRYWDLESGRLASQQVIPDAQDIGVSTDYTWALFPDQLKLFDEQGRTLKMLPLAGMDHALLNGRFGVAWSDVRLCSLDLKELSRPACRPLTGSPADVWLTDRYVYASQQRDYDWTRWHSYLLPELEDLGSPQNLTGNDRYPEAVANPAPTPMFRSNIYNGWAQNAPVFELDGIKATRSFRPFSLRLGQMARHGKLLAASGFEESLLVYDPASDRSLESLPEQAPLPSWTAISGNRLITISDDPLQPMIRVYGLPGLRLETELDGHASPIQGAKIFGSLLVTSDGQELRLWDLEQHSLKDSLALQGCAPREILYQAPRLIYLCEGQRWDYDDNGNGQIRRDTGQHQLLLLTIDQGKFRLLDRYTSSEHLWPLRTWTGNELTTGNGQQFELQNNQLRLLEPKPETQVWLALIGTWPEIILKEGTREVSNLRLISSLDDGAKARTIPDLLPVASYLDNGLKVTADQLIKLNPPGSENENHGQIQNLQTGTVSSFDQTGREFPLSLSRYPDEIVYQIDAWELRLNEDRVITSNPDLKIENHFLYPAPTRTSPEFPTVWLEVEDWFLIHWERGGLLQRCRLGGYCSEAQVMPRSLGSVVKVGNRLLGRAASRIEGPASPTGTQPMPNREQLWIWNAENLELLQVLPLANYTRLVEISPPGTVTLYRESNPGETGFNRHQILRLADGKILATYYSLVRPEGLLIMSEDGYYAGMRNYRELVYLRDGNRELGLKDFPEFHRPDLVWQLLQGKAVDKLPAMPGLRWDDYP
ncbi:MAG: WD40 repeat domain-containing protein [Candidatus Sericytochromatia bacterium]